MPVQPDEHRDGHPELPLDPDAPDVGVGVRPLHLSAGAVAVVCVGGAAGTAARYGLTVLAPTRAGQWPVSTFVANVAGAFVLGLLLEVLARAGTDDGWRRRIRLLAGTGFCGGLTTYSTLAVESDLLIRGGRSALGVAYLTVTVLAGLLATTAGIATAAQHRRRLDHRRAT